MELVATQELINCYHCGEQVDGKGFAVETSQGQELCCCPGCQAAARMIQDSGLEGYYQFRDQYAPKPLELDDEQKEQLRLYDLEEVQDRFRHATKDGYEASWIIEGLSCAACVWLIEKQLQDLPKIQDARVNLTTGRMQLKWHPQAKLSQVIAQVKALGYGIKPYSQSNAEKQAAKENRQFILRLAVANLASMQVMMNTFFLTGHELGIADIALINWMSLILTLPVILYSCQPFFINAWRGLKHRQPGMDVPVSLGLGLAFIASLWSTFTGTGETHYESVTMFAGFLLIGRYIEFRARRAFGDSGNELEDVLPLTCHRVVNGRSEEITVNKLTPNDLVQVSPGMRFPCDGIIVSGQTEVDCSYFSGESLPVARGPKDSVQAGTLNLSQVVQIKALNTGSNTQISALRQLMDRASESKPRIAELADIVSRYFVVAVLIICSFTFALWWFWLDQERAFWVALSVLVVTCPCALGLATPMSLSVATTTLRRNGFLITRSHVLERLTQVQNLLFDKTGTLTKGQLKLQQVIPIAQLDETQILALVAAMEQGQNHPIAQALVQAGPEQLPQLDDKINHGQGISARWQGQQYRLGKPQWVANSMPPDDQFAWLLLANEQGLVAWLALSDELREDAHQAISQLTNRGYQLQVLSGDQHNRVQALTKTLGIPSFAADLRPEQKLDRLKGLTEPSLMVGDGLNDAPILAAADVSVAMANASELTRHNSDVLLLNNQLTLLPRALTMAQLTQANIKQNLSIALIYNLLALPAAMAGLIAPWLGAIGMTLSSVVVVVNALRLHRMPK